MLQNRENSTKNNSDERLSLGPIRDKDYSSLIYILKDSTVNKTYMVPDISTEAQALEIFQRLKEISERSDRYCFAIFLDDELIGLIHDTEIRRNTVELGYALHPDHFGQGYMTWALKAVIKKLFEIGFAEITAGAFKENAASIRVMQKCGMQSTGKSEVIEYRQVKHLCMFYSIKNNQ